MDILGIYLIQPEKNTFPNETLQKKMLKSSFFARNYESAHPDEKVTIYCQLELEGFERDTPFSTKLKIPKKYWIDGYVSNDYHLCDSAVDTIKSIEKAFADIFILVNHLHEEDEWTYDLIRNYYDPALKKVKIKPKPRLFAVIEEFMASKLDMGEIKKSTWKTYRTRKQNIDSWMNDTDQKDLKINEVRHRHFKSLKAWLKKQKNEDGSPRFGIDHINKHLTFVKSTLDYAVNEEYIKYSSIGRLNLKYSKIKPPTYLFAEHRKAISDCTLKTLEKTRDISIFLAHTGFSYVDYQDLETSHLVITPQGVCFKKEREKSGIFSLPPLLPEAKEIIEKYGSIENLPRPDLADINKDLKILGEVCGLTKETVGFELTTSVFRETFSSMMENEFFLSNRVIMYMMGHTNPKQLNNYSSVMPARIFHEMSSGIQVLKGKVFETLINELKKAS